MRGYPKTYKYIVKFIINPCGILDLITKPYVTHLIIYSMSYVQLLGVMAGFDTKG